MKRLVILSIVLVLSFSLVGGATAESNKPKPPNRICLRWSNSNFVTALVIQPAGKRLKMADGKVKFYSIHGESISAFDNVIAPVYGTGHMYGNTFHFSLTGSTFETEFMLQHVMLTFEGFFNVVDRTGVGTHMYMYERKADNVMIGYEYPESTLEKVPCGEQQIHR